MFLRRKNSDVNKFSDQFKVLFCIHSKLLKNEFCHVCGYFIRRLSIKSSHDNPDKDNECSIDSFEHSA